MEPNDIPLRDIHLPEAIGWWPLAPGWWVIIGLLLVSSIALTAVYLYRRKRRVQRAALAEFRVIKAQFAEHGDKQALAAELSKLARRTVMALDDSGAAALTGPQWAERFCALTKQSSSHTALPEILAVAPYRRAAEFDEAALLEAFQPWLSDLQPLRSTKR